MKSIASLCLAALLFALVACGGSVGPTSSANPPAPPPPPPPPSGGGTPPSPPPPAPPADIHAVNHVLIMFQENRSFDHYFGFMTKYRNAHGIPINSSDGLIRDLSDPAAAVAAAANGPTGIYHTGSVCTEDLTPDWRESHDEMSRGNPAGAGPKAPMNGFVNVAFGLSQFYGVLADKDGHRAMGIFDDSQLNYYYFMASNFAMGDMFFSPVPTRTSSNRLFIHAATSAGTVHADENVTNQFNSKTIWRALDEKGISWKIYISDWPKSTFTFFDFFTDSSDPNRQKNVVSIDQYFTDVANNTLPAVAFIETGMNTGRDEHPSNNPAPGIVSPPINVQAGQAWVAKVINALMTSPSWKDSVFFWTFDEGGGAFDHVPPISVPSPDGIKPRDFIAGKDTFGGDFTITGFRVPNFIASPFAKKNFVSHTPMDYTAILKFVETRWGLQPLTARDASMPDMTEFFDFTNGGPWATPPTPPAPATNGVCDFTKE